MYEKICKFKQSCVKTFFLWRRSKPVEKFVISCCGSVQVRGRILRRLTGSVSRGKLSYARLSPPPPSAHFYDFFTEIILSKLFPLLAPVLL